MSRGMSHAVFGLALCGSLLGCGSCPSGPKGWENIGYLYGSAGHKIDMSSVERKYREACSKDGLPIDFSAFERGAKLGRKDYCAPTGAFSLGEGSGSAFQPELCPSMTGADITLAMAANKAGRQAHKYQQEINSIYAENHLPNTFGSFLSELPDDDRDEVIFLESLISSLRSKYR